MTSRSSVTHAAVPSIDNERVEVCVVRVDIKIQAPDLRAPAPGVSRYLPAAPILLLPSTLPAIYGASRACP